MAEFNYTYEKLEEMYNERKSGSVIVSWDMSHNKDADVLIVGMQTKNEGIKVINAYQGEEARYIHRLLTVKGAANGRNV